MINGINSNIDYVEESDYSFASRNIDIWHGDFPHKQGDNFPDAKLKKRASISKTNRLLFNNDYTSILNKMLDVIPEIDPIYGMQIKEIVANIPYFKTVVDGFVSLICSTMPIIDSPDSIDARLSTILADSNLYSTLDYRFKSVFMDVIDVYVVSKNSQGKAYIKTIPVKNCIVYNDCNDITSTYCIEVFNITDEIIEFINYFMDGRIEKRTFKYYNGTIGEQVGEVEKTLAYNGKYNVCPAGFIKHNVENPDDTYGIDQFRYWDSSITSVCRSFVNLFRLNEKCREILRKVPESSLSRLNSGSYSFVNKGTIVYPDGVTKEQRPDIEYVIPELRNNIESEIQVLEKSIKLVSSSSGLSPVWFDFEKLGTNLSAKSLKAAMIPTTLKATMMCNNMTDALKDIVVKIGLLYDIQLNKSDITVTWFDGIADDDDVEYVSRRLENNTMSQEDAIVYLDHISRRTAKERMNKINNTPNISAITDKKDEYADKTACNEINVKLNSNGDGVDDTRNTSGINPNPNVIPDYQMPLIP